MTLEVDPFNKMMYPFKLYNSRLPHCVSVFSRFGLLNGNLFEFLNLQICIFISFSSVACVVGTKFSGTVCEAPRSVGVRNVYGDKQGTVE